ncbi:hypothetical protein L5F68_08250 [Aliarcobacter butzleri]|uniref:hypothetical protein n=1 Tax=Aliarcobacter butzleri TaxID=28197 RepID=UPI001EDCE1DD|nr:hypothetical protein [Aliarcobacter butzleri]MCG3704323.1 hypothetical protein [Aliarcobacter butzleri]
MKILNKYILLIVLFLNSFLFAESTKSAETEFTTGAKLNDSCAIECPNFKEGYFGRIADFNYENGETSCYVYSKQAPTKILATVVNVNPHCSKNLKNSEKVEAINSNNTAVNSHLNSIREQVLNKFTDGGSSTYLNLPKYMVAGLLADDRIIDLSSSVSTNEIVLKGGYTTEVNVNFATGDKVTNQDMLSRVKDGLANSVTFVINFLSSSDKIFLSLKVVLFLFVGALSVFLIVSQKTTKKISKLQDHEDTTEKVLFGFFSIVIFFLSLNKVATPDGQISQTGYQQLIRPLLYLGIDTADKLAETATKSVLKYKFAEVGIVAVSDLQTLRDLKYKYEKKKEVANTIKEICFARYNTDEIKAKSQTLASNYTFPNSEYITLGTGAGVLTGGSVDFYNKFFLVNEADILTNELPSVTYCYKNEKMTNELTSKINDLNIKLNNISNGGINSKIIKNINGITELTYKNIAEFGFAGIGSLATSTMAFNNFSLIQDEKPSERKAKSLDLKTDKIREATGYEVSSLVSSEEKQNFISAQLNGIIAETPYFMLPMAGSLKEYITVILSPILGSKDKDGNGEGALNYLIDMIPTKWISTPLSGLVALGNSYAINMITLSILRDLVSIAPLLAIIGASFLVMSFYFLSVGILYIVIPFASIFALSTGNLDIIKNLIKYTFILAVKPVLIVVSVIMAFFVLEMFQSLNSVLVSSMFEPLFLLANNMEFSTDSFSSFFDGLQGIGNSIIFLFLKSAMMMLSSLITVFVCFYIIFNGTNIILDILGMKDGGFDIGNTIGDKVENKPIVSKINTVV